MARAARGRGRPGAWPGGCALAAGGAGPCPRGSGSRLAGVLTPPPPYPPPLPRPHPAFCVSAVVPPTLPPSTRGIPSSLLRQTQVPAPGPVRPCGTPRAASPGRGFANTSDPGGQGREPGLALSCRSAGRGLWVLARRTRDQRGPARPRTHGFAGDSSFSSLGVRPQPRGCSSREGSSLVSWVTVFTPQPEWHEAPNPQVFSPVWSMVPR